MYRLTDRRRKKAQRILDAYKLKHDAGQPMSAKSFEKELRECWNIGYQELKDIIEDLSKIEEYTYLAAFYMENSNSGFGVVSEFKPVLAKLYGIKWYDAPERASARDQFWEKHCKQR